MEFLTQEKLNKPADASALEYVRKFLPMLKALMKTKKPDGGGTCKLSWGPPSPRPKVCMDGIPANSHHGHMMVEIEKAVTQVLTEEGYNLEFVSGDASTAIWIHWKP